MSSFHYVKDSTYEDYLRPLCNLTLLNSVVDRHMFCEYPYQILMNRRPMFENKKLHNIILLTLIQKPVIVLCTHKPTEEQYEKDQYLPFSKWDNCLNLYRQFLTYNMIHYIEYDYTGLIKPSAIHRMHENNIAHINWWVPMWRDGIGCIGSPHPKVLLVAERLGPNNMNEIPFETGPTGYMLSKMLEAAGTPLNAITITNMVKSHRRDARAPNSNDLGLLSREIEHLQPKTVVFMGKTATQGIKIAKNHDVKVEHIVHLGYHNYKGSSAQTMQKYHNEWKQIVNDAIVQ